jgi:ABC-2 type transport system permease protein
MNTILLIIQREFLTRVRKRSFLIMTFLGPLMMAAVVIIPVYIASQSDKLKNIAVIDDSGLFHEKFRDSDNIRFHYPAMSITEAKEMFGNSDDYALLYIPASEVTLPHNAIIYAQGQVNINVKSYIRNVLSKRVEDLKLEAELRHLAQDKTRPIDVDNVLRSIKTSIDLVTIKLGADGEEEKSHTEATMVVSLFGAILIYMFIFMFGSQVMRSVIEEKSNRIVEVIVSSVKPFQLMMGKIVGVAMVGLTQFMLWVILTFVIITGFTSAFLSGDIPALNSGQVAPLPPSGFDPDQVINLNDAGNQSRNEILEALNSINFPVMIGSFVFFFLLGYLMYAALFAAIGGAVDSEADTQQFMLPLTVPLIIAIVLAQFIIQEPDGPVAIWLSMIPLTSPVVMMIRIPFGVPYMEVALSMVLLVIGFLLTTWLAAKIYRTGILMYGKKISYRELWRWLRY